MFRPP